MLLAGAPAGVRVQFVGTTLSDLSSKANARLDLTGREALVFHVAKVELIIPYNKVSIIEYGQNVSRRYAAAVLISPIFLLSKSRKHFVTLGYVDAEGKHQALVFRADKGDIRGLLAGLEARTGRRIEFQDDEARKTGKG
jgi:hypothetical protein